MKEANSQIYHPLKDGEIRILALQPGSPSSVIECSLVHTAITGPSSMSYEALSYEWGLSQGNEPMITLDQRTVYVRRNLYEALWRFRREDRARYLWVDALCINQEDLAEKNHQVQIMGTIYERASSVLAWLGVADAQSSTAIKCFYRILQELSYNNDSLLVTDDSMEYLDSFAADQIGSEKRRAIWRKKQESVKGKPDPAIDKSRWSFIYVPDTEVEAILHFLSKSYWYRAWIVQEIVLAQQAFIVCGVDKIAHSDLQSIQDMMVQSQNVVFDGALSAVRHNHSDTFKIADAQGSRIMYLRKREEDCLALPDYISYCNECECATYHDYVYAFISMDPSCGIIVDYSKSLKTLVKEVRKLEKRDWHYYRARSATNVLRRRFFNYDTLNLPSIPGSAWRAMVSNPKCHPLYNAYKKYYGWSEPVGGAFE